MRVTRDISTALPRLRTIVILAETCRWIYAHPSLRALEGVSDFVTSATAYEKDYHDHTNTQKGGETHRTGPFEILSNGAL